MISISISIIGILSSIAIPNYKTCIHNVRVKRTLIEAGGFKTFVEGLYVVNGTYPNSGGWITRRSGNFATVPLPTDPDLNEILLSSLVLDSHVFASEKYG